MDTTVMRQRSHRAHARILAAAQYLAERHGLPDEYAAMQGAGERYRDPEIRALYEAEALAGFMEQIVTRGMVSSREAQAGVPAASLEALDISPRARLALIAAGITSAEDARHLSDDDLLSIDGIGPATVAALRKAAG